MKYIAVFAGNHYQFDSWVHDNPLPDDKQYIYVDRPEKAMTYRFERYELVGTYWERKDFRELQQEVEERMTP